MSEQTEQIDDGGPAFPPQYPPDKFLDEASEEQMKAVANAFRGMSLRDWLAGQALMGDMASQSNDIGEYTNGASNEYLLNRSKLFYRFADAMLAARKEKL